MARKHALVAMGLLISLATAAAATILSYDYVPDFYLQALSPPVDRQFRKQQAERFEQKTRCLVNDIKYADDWSQEFTEQQVNSWLAEELPHHETIGLPNGVSEPRIQLTQDAVLIAFRYEGEGWDTVINCHLQVRLVAPNELEIEVGSIRAGLIPLPLEKVLAEISQGMTKQGLDVPWTLSESGNAILVDLNRKTGDQPVLESLELREGSLHLSGRRLFNVDDKLAQLLILPQ